jgi:glycosyltransferase involved in cell wall biosynthesis
MKIVHISPIFWDNWGYQENYISRIQAEEGHQVTVLTSATSLAYYRKDLDGQYKEYFSCGVKIIRLRIKFNLINRFYWFDGLYNILKRINPEIIMVHGLTMLPVLQILKYKKCNPNCLLYADLHADYHISGTSFLSRIILHKFFWRIFTINRILPHVEQIYYTRPSVKRFSQEMYKIKDALLTELLMGADAPTYSEEARKEIKRKIRNKLGIPEDSFIICTGGKIDKNKQIGLLLKALQKIDNSKFYLIIFGNIADDYKAIYHSEISHFSNIKDIGWLVESEIGELFIASDIAVFLGNHSVLWEQAISYGTPVMFSYEEDRKYLDVGGNCIFVYSNNENEISYYINLLLEQPSIITNMKKIAIQKGIPKFSYKNIVQELNASWVS